MCTTGKTVFFGSPHFGGPPTTILGPPKVTHIVQQPQKTTKYNTIFGGYPWAGTGKNNASFSAAHPHSPNIILYSMGVFPFTAENSGTAENLSI
jgi:hypothetical protein